MRINSLPCWKNNNFMVFKESLPPLGNRDMPTDKLHHANAMATKSGACTVPRPKAKQTHRHCYGRTTIFHSIPKAGTVELQLHTNRKLSSCLISNMTVVTSTRVLHLQSCNSGTAGESAARFASLGKAPMHLEQKLLFQSSLLKKSLAKERITFPAFSDCCQIFTASIISSPNNKSPALQARALPWCCLSIAACSKPLQQEVS